MAKPVLSTDDKLMAALYTVVMLLFIAGNMFYLWRAAVVEECARILRDPAVRTVDDLRMALRHHIRDAGPVLPADSDGAKREIVFKLQQRSHLRIWVEFSPDTGIITDTRLVFSVFLPTSGVDLETGAGAGIPPFQHWPVLLPVLVSIGLWMRYRRRPAAISGWMRFLRESQRVGAVVLLVPLGFVDFFYLVDVVLLSARLG